MSARPPVEDWMTDWDHMDPRWTEDPYAIWDDIRQAKCPIAHTERYNGAYLPTTYQDIRDIAYDPEHFSSRQVIIRESYPERGGGAPPITSDPPKHRGARMLLMAPFSPHAVKSLIPKTTEICNELIDAFAGKTHFDGAVDYAQHIPVRVISHMLGLPDEDGDTFRNWVRQIVIEGITDVDAAQRGLDAVTDYFRQQIAQREKHLTDDLISQIMQFRYEDGTPFKENHVLGTLRLILVAGIDTTWSNIGASVWHLAQTPTDRKRLIDEPDLIASAVEELLRAFSPVTMARLVAKDKELNGCLFKQGDMVLLPFPAANRDPSKFKDADKVILDRADNRHAAFGLGIHRCIGAYLARMEMTVAIQQLLKRVPDFQLAGETTWSQGPIRGPRGLPIAIG